MENVHIYPSTNTVRYGDNPRGRCFHIVHGRATTKKVARAIQLLAEVEEGNKLFIHPSFNHND